MIVSSASYGDSHETLAIISRSRSFGCYVPIAPSLWYALENWSTFQPRLRQEFEHLSSQPSGPNNFLLAPGGRCIARSWCFLDGSAFISHARRIREARGEALASTFFETPLMYQGCGDTFAASNSVIEVPQLSFDADFEVEVAVIVDFVPHATSAHDALSHIRFVTLLNDITYRSLVPSEIARGFGFLQSKPANTVAQFAVSPDELGAAWTNGRLHATVEVLRNGDRIAELDTSEMHFHFGELIAHAARTRDLPAGCVIGSGTVSNSDPSHGFGCIIESRAHEQVARGAPSTSFLQNGDTITMDAKAGKASLFGPISQTVRVLTPA